MKSSMILAIGLPIAAAAAIGCGGSGGGSSLAPTGQGQLPAAPTAAPTSAPQSSSTVLPQANINGGPAFTNASGFAVYTDSTDSTNHSSCTGGCLSEWPAVTPPPGPLPSPWVSFTRSDTGTMQLSYVGQPLYTFAGDSRPDQATGDGVEGFHLARPAGITAAPTPTTAPTVAPTTEPTVAPTTAPTVAPSVAPSAGGGGPYGGG